MTESADQPLLAEQAGDESPAPKRRRTAAAKPRATAKAPAAKSEPAKPKKVVRAKKKETADESLPGFEPAEPSARPVTNGATSAAPEPPTAAPAERVSEPEPARKSREARGGRSRRGGRGPEKDAAMPMPPGAGVAEEWSPSRREAVSAAKSPTPRSEAPTPAPASAPAPVEAAPAAATPAESAPPPPPARKYPVYIPRHVAKQLEEQGQQVPVAVPADAIPEAARAAVEAAQAAHPSNQQRAERTERADHGERDDRGGDRRDRRHRHDRRDNRDSRDNRGERRDQDDMGGREDNRPEVEQPLGEELGIGEGIVEISGKGFGFIRDPKRNFAQHPQDIFVTPEQVRRYNLRDGQWIKGETRRGGRGAQLSKLLEINGADPEGARILPAFDELTVISPMERIGLEITPERSTTRIIDLFTPIGKGQRGIIVAPPRTGKTTLLQHIADAVMKKHPDIKLIFLLVDERPEEVTDIRRTVPGAEVMASSNDSDVKSHTRIAQLAIERAKRLVESGHDVFVLLDSITRVGRAFNNAMAGGGRTMSGGVDARALEIPRKLFAAARNTEEAGSLTIIATALIETGSRMDELIFQEFKGTGNMELVLDRKIADQRIYPAIDIFQSGTRREELLIPADDLHKINLIRRGLAGHKPMEAIERLLFFLKKFPTNAQMLAGIPG
jgi:transcription termination factor Rho